MDHAAVAGSPESNSRTPPCPLAAQLCACGSLLTLEGWTSQRIAEVYLVRQDTVRFWRGDFLRGGVEALKASIAPGLPPVKTEAALRVVAPLLEAPVADRPNWTIPRLIEEVKRVERVTVSRSTMSKALRKKTSGSGDRGTR